MLFAILKALLGTSEKEVAHQKKQGRKLTQKERDALEYKLWEMAEEYREE